MEKTIKIANNNQPAGGDVWKTPRPEWGNGSSPLRPSSELWRGEGAGLPKTAGSLSWVKKYTKKYSNNNQLVRGNVWGPLRDCRGS